MIHVELYRPVEPGPHTLLLMLHGSAGAFSLRPSGERGRPNFGEDRLASACFVVALPHYFETAGISSITDVDTLRARYPYFLGVVQGVLDEQLRTIPSLAPGVAVYGESYGGFLAIGLTLQNKEIAVVSVTGAALPDTPNTQRASLPPLLIQHGQNDTIVPLDSALQLYTFWTNAKSAAKLVVYPDVGHYLSEDTREQIDKTTEAWLLNVR